MKRQEFDTVKAMAMDGCGSYLMTDSNTVDGVKQEIDAANERAIKHGYKAEQFIITCVENYVYRSDDGVFVKRETYETAIEVYPAQI